MTAVWTLLGVLVLAVGLLVSVALHEVGHLVTAKRFDVRVTQYMVGFGRTLWSTRRGETEYGIKAVPLGGYVRMIGMTPPAPGDRPGELRRSSTGPLQALVEDARRAAREELQPGDEDRVFYRKPWWQKVVVMVAGAGTNLVIAALLLLVALCLIGRPVTEAIPTVQSVSQCVVPPGRADAGCQPGDPRAPAGPAGVRVGDRIVAVNGTPVSTWKQASTAIERGGPGFATVAVERGGRTIVLGVTLATAQREDATGVLRDVGFLGVAPQVVYTGTDRLSVTELPGVVATGVGQTAGVVLSLPQRMVGVWQAATGGQRRIDSPIGVVGAGRIGGELAAQPDPLYVKAFSLIALLASVNLALFVFNLVPLPPLDGGAVAGALWEAVRRGWARLRRRPDPGFVDVAKLLPLTYVIAALLVGMSALLLYADIVNPVHIT